MSPDYLRRPSIITDFLSRPSSETGQHRPVDHHNVSLWPSFGTSKATVDLFGVECALMLIAVPSCFRMTCGGHGCRVAPLIADDCLVNHFISDFSDFPDDYAVYRDFTSLNCSKASRAGSIHLFSLRTPHRS